MQISYIVRFNITNMGCMHQETYLYIV